jgi:hypothetical protein
MVLFYHLPPVAKPSGGDIFRTVGLLSPIINYPSQGITFACENNRGILSARTRSIRGDACSTFEKYPPDHYIRDTLYRHTAYFLIYKTFHNLHLLTSYFTSSIVFLRVSYKLLVAKVFTIYVVLLLAWLKNIINN